MTTEDLKTLAQAARPINESDWGSARQIKAENALFDCVGSFLSDANQAELARRNHRASTTERIDNALAFLGEIAARSGATL